MSEIIDPIGTHTFKAKDLGIFWD